jgi:transcriptional regulator with XRE-family HTH domain
MEKLDSFSNRLKSLRECMNWTQSQLAERLGVSMNYVYMLENGRQESEKIKEKFLTLENECIRDKNRKLLASVESGEWKIATHILLSGKSEEELKDRADVILAEKSRPLSERVAFGKAILGELERRKKLDSSKEKNNFP